MMRSQTLQLRDLYKSRNEIRKGHSVTFCFLFLLLGIGWLTWSNSCLCRTNCPKSTNLNLWSWKCRLSKMIYNFRVQISRESLWVMGPFVWLSYESNNSGTKFQIYARFDTPNARAIKQGTWRSVFGNLWSVMGFL